MVPCWSAFSVAVIFVDGIITSILLYVHKTKPAPVSPLFNISSNVSQTLLLLFFFIISIPLCSIFLWLCPSLSDHAHMLWSCADIFCGGQPSICFSILCRVKHHLITRNQILTKNFTSFTILCTGRICNFHGWKFDWPLFFYFLVVDYVSFSTWKTLFSL